MLFYYEQDQVEQITFRQLGLLTEVCIARKCDNNIVFPEQFYCEGTAKFCGEGRVNIFCWGLQTESRNKIDIDHKQKCYSSVIVF